MKNKKFIYIMNWKMYFSFNEALEFCKKNVKELSKLNAVLCPSFESIYPIAQIFKKTKLKIGAQDCSSFDSGPYTSQVSGKSLKEIGVSYCIVGHSEISRYCKEDLKAKVDILIKNKIKPILCVGEIDKKQENKKILEEQLKNFVNYNNIYIAYEPVWAIGTGMTPAINYLEKTLKFISKFGKYKLIYGGSVDANNINLLKKISLLDGFLIGSASLDFQKWKNIVS